MTTSFAIDRDLVVRFGKATYEFNRYLNDHQTLQFENQQTGEYRSFQLTDFYRKVRDGVLQPVLGSDEPTAGRACDPAAILDLSSLPEKIKDTLNFRRSIVRYMQKARISRGQRGKVAKGIDAFCAAYVKKNRLEDQTTMKRPSTSSVMNWMRRFETSGCNITALLSGNANRRRPTTVHPAVEASMIWALDKHYLTRARHSLQHAHGELQRRLQELVKKRLLPADRAVVSMATFQRRKADLDPYMVLTRRYAPGYAKTQLRVTMDGTVVHRAMQRYEIDHTLLNWVVVCDRTGMPLGRPTLTVVIDSFSGYVVGLYVSFNGPGLTSVLNVIKNCILPKGDLAAAAGATKPWIAFGIPDCLILDNGMEFHSKAFRLAAWELSVDLEYCRVRTPWLKPRVERFFANLDYMTLSKGRVHKPMANVLNVDPKLDAAITLSRLCKGLVLFACDKHGHTPNSRTLELPYQRYADSVAQNPPPSLPVSLAGLDIIAAMSKELSVAQGGVEFYGLSYAGYETRELIQSAGGKFRTLCKWNPDNLAEMFVQHPRTNEWVTLHCTRPDYAVGLTFNQHRLLRKFTRQRLKLDGTIDNLLAAQWRLSDLWLEPLAKRNVSLDHQHARRYAGQMTGAWHVGEHENGIEGAKKLVVAPEELVFEADEIPKFDTFSLA
jgi:putative transposase